jgi:uncharacterized protein YhaN
MAKLTDQEVAAMPSMTDADWAAIRASQEKLEAEERARAAVRESAIAKLAQLGLTPNEITSLIP